MDFGLPDASMFGVPEQPATAAQLGTNPYALLFNAAARNRAGRNTELYRQALSEANAYQAQATQHAGQSDAIKTLLENSDAVDNLGPEFMRDVLGVPINPTMTNNMYLRNLRQAQDGAAGHINAITAAQRAGLDAIPPTDSPLAIALGSPPFTQGLSEAERVAQINNAPQEQITSSIEPNPITGHLNRLEERTITRPLTQEEGNDTPAPQQRLRASEQATEQPQSPNAEVRGVPIGVPSEIQTQGAAQSILLQEPSTVAFDGQTVTLPRGVIITVDTLPNGNKVVYINDKPANEYFARLSRTNPQVFTTAVE